MIGHPQLMAVCLVPGLFVVQADRPPVPTHDHPVVQGVQDHINRLCAAHDDRLASLGSEADLERELGRARGLTAVVALGIVAGGVTALVPAGYGLFLALPLYVVPLLFLVPIAGNRATGQLLRRWGYAMEQTQGSPPAFAGAAATSAVIAGNVSDCHFDYQPSGIGAQIGLLTLRLTLARTLSESTQTVSLYHAVHVNNVP